MSRVRIYLPLTAADLDALSGGTALTRPTAYAVTVRLASITPGADPEELEYAAFLLAAAAAGRARGSDPTTRRVVAAADVEAESVTEQALPEGRTPAEVALAASVPARAIVSFHVDELPGGTDDADLLWFDASELLSVRQLLS
jgi:hypothetical protein